MTEGLVVECNDLEEILSDADCEIDNQIKELKHDFHDDLTDKPDILKYIERLHTIIRRQQKKLNKFYKKLKDHKFVKKHGTQDKESQTGIEGLESDSKNSSWGLGDHSSDPNIADEVKEVAENAMKNTSFVYEPTSGMYYDYNTGYYYNAELRMYYDGNTGRYLEYDEETKTYKYHSTNAEFQATNTNQKPKSSLKGKKKRSKFKSCPESEVDALVRPLTKLSLQTAKSAIESGAGCEPCIRIIVEETNVDKLKIGSLFVVTCKGGTMGREGDHAVLIPDINVSKHHAKFVYDSRNSSYYITDLGSRNGTWLDGERLSAALQESEKFEINHGAVIQIGSTKLLCHVHVGRDTCASCEPGLVQQTREALVWDSGIKNSEYREQLQNLRKKFGVDGLPQDVYNVPGYEDRAEIRRTLVGSSHSSEKTQAASVTDNNPVDLQLANRLVNLNESERMVSRMRVQICAPGARPKCATDCALLKFFIVISQGNKGFKMLSKMGWSEGQKLGKNDSGLVEPVPMVATVGKSGLGSSYVEGPKLSKFAIKKQDILKKTQDRYKNIEGT